MVLRQHDDYSMSNGNMRMGRVNGIGHIVGSPVFLDLEQEVVDSGETWRGQDCHVYSYPRFRGCVCGMWLNVGRGRRGFCGLSLVCAKLLHPAHCGSVAYLKRVRMVGVTTSYASPEKRRRSMGAAFHWRGHRVGRRSSALSTTVNLWSLCSAKGAIKMFSCL